jgi:hypothetical protein
VLSIKKKWKPLGCRTWLTRRLRTEPSPHTPALLRSTGTRLLRSICLRLFWVCFVVLYSLIQ